MASNRAKVTQTLRLSHDVSFKPEKTAIDVAQAQS
jgi:hypothetical protein